MKPIKLKTTKGLKKFDPDKYLADKKFVRQALFECLFTNDMEAFKDILGAYVSVMNKRQISEEAHVPKRTLYRMLSDKGNPRMDNLFNVLSHIGLSLP